ncbi:MAG: nucleoside recognition protein [Ruminiclostridium sp.]|nr:nucleoside recognition protein [Ruminiclostridium sp.]
MLNYIWAGMLVIGFIFGIINGRISEVTRAAVDSAGKAIELAIALLGIMCLWTGLMAIAEKSGGIRFISRLFRPLLRILFPGIPRNHPAMGAIVMNLSANFLGLGNAATPLGLKAMNELQKLNPDKSRATDAMCMFLVLNTAAVQLIPSTIIAVRTDAGSANPAEIITAVWIASICATAAGIIAVKIFTGTGGFRKRHERKNIIKAKNYRIGA